MPETFPVSGGVSPGSVVGVSGTIGTKDTIPQLEGDDADPDRRGGNKRSKFCSPALGVEGPARSRQSQYRETNQGVVADGHIKTYDRVRHLSRKEKTTPDF